VELVNTDRVPGERPTSTEQYTLKLVQVAFS